MHLQVRVEWAKVLILLLLRANQDFVRYCVQQAQQLLLVLPGIYFGQEHFDLTLLLHVED